MTRIRKYRFFALLACAAMLAVVCGCHGGAAGIACLLGSWDGEIVKLAYAAMTVILSQTTLGIYSQTGGSSGSSAVGPAQAGDDLAEVWANFDDGHGGTGFINYVGTLVENGSNVTANLTPRGVAAGQVNGDTMTLDLQVESETKLTGTMTWIRDGSPYTGPCTFDKYPDH